MPSHVSFNIIESSLLLKDRPKKASLLNHISTQQELDYVKAIEKERRIRDKKVFGLGTPKKSWKTKLHRQPISLVILSVTFQQE